MRKETLSSRQNEQTEEVESSDMFDLSMFFDKVDEQAQEEEIKESSDLLIILRNDSDESIAILSSKLTAETFAKGVTLASGVFSALGSIVGSCGVFCGHGLGAIAKMGSSGFGGVPGLGGLNMPGFNVDSNGNFHLDGNIDFLSNLTGISNNDLLSGKFSSEDILVAFFSSFGESVSMIFGFGLIGGIIDAIFDNFPTVEAA